MGKSNPIPPQLTEKEISRFWSYISTAEGQGPEGTCWEWQRGKSVGYGSFAIGGRKSPRKLTSHRLSFFLTYGIWTPDNVCHHCDNRACCRPDHLFEGTDYDNLHDAHEKGRLKQWDELTKSVDNRGDRNGMRKHPECIRRGSSRKGSKLTETDIPIIRARYTNGETLRAIAKDYGVWFGVIHGIVKHRAWIHV